MNHRGPLPLRELHSTDETLVWRDPGGSWACLRPVYYYGWNHPVRVAVTGIDGTQCQKTKQPYIWRARKNRTRLRRARQQKIHEKDQWRITKMSPLNTWNQQNHQREKGLRTNPKLELSRSKQPWILLRTKPLKTGRPKNKPELKKLTSERIRALQTAQKTTPQEKSWVEDGSGKQREKVTLRREKGALHKRKQSY